MAVCQANRNRCLALLVSSYRSRVIEKKGRLSGRHAFDFDLDLDLERPIKPRRPEFDVAAWGEPAGMPV